MSDTTLATVIAAGNEVEIAGRPVRLYPLTLGDVAEWDAWAQRAFLRAAALDQLPPIHGDGPDALATFNQQADYRSQAFSEARCICLGSGKAIPQMYSPEGAALAVSLSLHHGPKCAGPETMLAGENLRSTVANIIEAAKVVYVLSGLRSEDKPKVSADPLAPAKPSPAPVA